ncbi:helix-turn-helix domain-containing protein [Reichenbachiella ulvae]|uniref:Helix-turn-helix domain-containing protein n=1 Tax=Reichenbachiella ulvae TaxID=2980104 RepID=A0ABT3CUR2_9BACT|nr:helix-turn-helix transcriptional regulator [Reichenbachiella ulvae]MCV9387431.1 helix-turn-helix domain-containing protein [Reichenbachiella ulvae]
MNYQINEIKENSNQQALERLKQLIVNLGLSKAEFARKLGYKSPHPIYMILNGSNKISNSFIRKLELSTLRVNTEWLLHGDGEMRTKEILNLQYGNEVFHNGRVIYPRRLSKHQVLILALKFAELIYDSPEDYYFTIEVQSISKFGLGFVFTKFSSDPDPKFDEVTYAGIMHYVNINPEWKITGYYDSWRNSQETARCQNLLNDQVMDEFDSVIRKYLLDLHENFEFPEKDLFKSSITSHEGFITIYENLPRDHSSRPS